ncbi:hypothetical protein FCV43_18120 [Vibrio genomosp. F6]|nr:hypothetical protein FCV43_18120 [Vibrio genomosp. F6]
MNILFTIYTNNTSWNATIHQLNSDVLYRHVMHSGNLSNSSIHFTYDEFEKSGKILDQNEHNIGQFSLQ